MAAIKPGSQCIIISEAGPVTYAMHCCHCDARMFLSERMPKQGDLVSSAEWRRLDGTHPPPGPIVCPACGWTQPAYAPLSMVRPYGD